MGARDISLEIIIKSFTEFDNSFDHLVIQTVGLPRSLIAIAVGASLSVSGALMQGLARNPLAETGILGISACGALAVVGLYFSLVVHHSRLYVAIAGPIGFVGLVVPHGVCFFIKTDYRWILPYSTVFGSILLLVSDIVARLLLKPQELPVGIITALVGAPVFVYLAKSKVKK